MSFLGFTSTRLIKVRLFNALMISANNYKFVTLGQKVGHSGQTTVETRSRCLGSIDQTRDISGLTDIMLYASPYAAHEWPVSAVDCLIL